MAFLFSPYEDTGTPKIHQGLGVHRPSCYQDFPNHCKMHNHKPCPIPGAPRSHYLSRLPILLLCTYVVTQESHQADTPT